MQIIAHRGASLELPENTLMAFERAIEIGVDALETDLLLTKDQKLVLRHDDLIQQGRKWYRVGDLTYKELTQIDAGNGQQIPLFEEFMELFGQRIPVMLDLKCFGLADLLIPWLQRKNYQSIHFTSFIHSEIRKLALAFPDKECSIVLASLPIDFKPLFESSHTRQVSLFRGYLNENHVRMLQYHDITVRIYPVNLPQEADLFRSWNVDGIFTDDPGAIANQNPV
ncbi:glycerophosphodiester phosphodiesterase [Omnitrophica bacterium]|nr:glycerophosphodiester phosphodiesterase [Candidatus Omnitrophota bacterium]